MKNKLMILGIACFTGMQLHAQNTIPPKTTFVPPVVQVKLNNVSAVAIQQDSVTIVTHPGKTNTNVYHFKGIINSKGPGPINYKWAIINTSTANIPPAYKAGSITPGGSGTDNVFVDMGNGGNGYSKITLVIISPTQITSNSITY